VDRDNCNFAENCQISLSLPSDCSPVSCGTCIIVDVYQHFRGICPIKLCGVTTQKTGVWVLIYMNSSDLGLALPVLFFA
jgi:hypothetical protein